MNLNLGDTQLLINYGKSQGITLDEMAYILATTYHETSFRMKPIQEMGGNAYLKGKAYYPFFGRGYVQLTWKYNYEKAGKILGVDFVKNPEKLLDSKYAVPIAIIGMKEGWFTGKKLKDYIDNIEETYEEDLREYSNSRKIINGLDKAVTIGKYAMDYRDALHASGYSGTPVVTPQDHVPVVKKSIWIVILEFILSLFKRK